MMIIYLFFTVILMLNVLIALINVAFNTSDTTWHLVFLENRLWYIESAENMSYHIPGLREKYDIFPKEICYCLTEARVLEYKARWDMKDDPLRNEEKSDEEDGADRVDKNDLVDLKTRTVEETFGYDGFKSTDFDPWRSKVQEPQREEEAGMQETVTTTMSEPVGAEVQAHEEVHEMTEEEWQQYEQSQALLLAPPPPDDSARMDRMERQLERIERLLSSHQGQKTRPISSSRAFQKVRRKFVPKNLSKGDRTPAVL
ncbi:hypothetical protein EMPS_00464 [Entomortierella parvispora]|uniref:Ion transport domain-containing protein n=1 Tax=Entomortierella parvispora TaxID=205924 RepID=A0A9P3H101_9FUNG|nr:hypothetical protein EMPS_00464 [Entomortierella parvispora]